MLSKEFQALITKLFLKLIFPAKPNVRQKRNFRKLACVACGIMKRKIKKGGIPTQTVKEAQSVQVDLVILSSRALVNFLLRSVANNTNLPSKP